MSLTNTNLPKFAPERYQEISLNDLVMYAVYFIAEHKNEINAEEIVAACFLLFPSRFQLRGYPQWPDSTVVNKRWLDCRDRGYITGSTAHGFSITPKGLELAEKTASVLSGQRRNFSRRTPSKLTAEARTRAGRFIRSLEASDAYKQFQPESETADISEFDFRSMLLCTMESSTATLNSNLEQFKQYAALYERQDFVDFNDSLVRVHDARFYGTVTCDYLHTLLKAEEPVLTATRDGVNRKHQFTKALKELIESELTPLVEEERKRAQAEEHRTISKKLRERLNIALQQLNLIANSELGKLSGGTGNNGGNGEEPPFIPASGFGFVPEYVLIQTTKAASMTLRAAVPDWLDAGTLVTIESSNPEVTILTPQVVIQPREDFTGVGQARVELEGRQVGTEAIITARVNGLKCEALVKVISKKEPRPSPEMEKKKGGLFRDVKFDPRAEPKQRVHFDREKSLIVVATKAPSVAAYFDESGKGHEEPQGQVLLAELITEAVCREIARRGVENGNFLSPANGQADAIQQQYIRLQNQHAHRVHTCFVDCRYRRCNSDEGDRKGRPSRAEMLENTAVAA